MTFYDPFQTRIDYIGPDLSEGMLPAFFYFALSGSESLHLHPYSQPARFLAEAGIRVFSYTIPGHEEGQNKFDAMHYWAEQLAAGKPILEDFFTKTARSIEWLIEQGIADPLHLAAGGLSRGGFVATHIAAQVKSIHTLLGFAPLTELNLLKEFSNASSHSLDLVHIVESLAHVQHLRFYIGNLDTRVGTDACFCFIRRLAEVGHMKRLKQQSVELMITQSIGHKGHGTAPATFEEGAHWIQNLISKK
jgi:hypothetical protein